jgi:general secretion pathway protein G
MVKIRGFTLVELMVVLTIIALLISIVAPDYVGRTRRAEEAVLKQNLSTMRDALDKHYADAGRYPGSLDELVAKRYLRAIRATAGHAQRQRLGRALGRQGL